MARKIGFSLSFCIKDIVEEKVNIEDVHHIVTGCSPCSEQDVEDIVLQYEQVYWRKYAKEARETLNELRRMRKIMWCSAFNKSPVNIGSFHWVNCPE
jgi:hypothetical protein